MTGLHTLPLGSTVFLLRDGGAYLLRRSHTGYRDGWWSAAGGRLEEGESFLACAVRELAEEVGVTALPQDLEGPVMMHSQDGNGVRIVAYYACRKWKGEPRNLEPDKHDRAEWVPVSALPADMTPYVRSALLALLSGAAPALLEEGFPSPGA